jgi:hypothetical protein
MKKFPFEEIELFVFRLGMLVMFIAIMVRVVIAHL